MLNYQALYYLLEVSSARSFTLAAEKLHMTRPAISTAIKNLEKDLGFPLLTRSHEGVTLTPQGETVVALAQKGFAFFDEIEHLTVQQPEMPATLSVYSAQALNVHFIPSLVKKYYELYPAGTLSAQPIGSATPEEIVLQHPDCFVLSIFNESRQLHKQVQSIIFDKSKAYLAMSPDATFLPRETKSISLKELLPVPLIETSIGEEQSFSNDLLAALRKHGEPNIRFTASDTNMAARLVENKLGATFFVTFKNFQTAVSSNYRMIPIKNAPKFVLAVLYHEDMPLEKVDFFLSLLNQI